MAWVTLLGTMSLNFGIVNAAQLNPASVALSDPRPSATSTYTTTASNVTSASIKCIKAVFSTSPSSAVNIGNGFTAASATVTAASSTLVNSSGTGWTLTPTANNITYTHNTGITPSTTTNATFVLAGVVNSSIPNVSYFMQFSTYDNVDCTTSPVDNTTLAFIFTPGSTLSLTVDPTLSFTVNTVASGASCNGATSTQASTSTTIPFGTVTTASNSIVCQDLSVATNAGSGYTVFIRYTAKPTSGANQIADHTGTNAAPTSFSAAGTESYGYTTNDATLQALAVNRFTSTPDVWAANTTSNAEVAYDAAPVASQTTRVGHQVGISGVTKPGTYTTTVIYTCTPIY